MYLKKKHFEQVLTISMDIASITISVILAFMMRLGIKSGVSRETISMWLLLVAVYLFSRILLVDSSFFQRGMLDEFVRTIKKHILLLGGTTILMYLSQTGDAISRLAFTYFFAIDIVLMFTVRVLLKRYLFKNYRLSKRSRRMLVLTDSGQVEEVIESLRKNKEWDCYVEAICIVDQDWTGRVVHGIPVTVSYEKMLEYIRLNAIDEVFVRIDKDFPVSMKTLITNLESMGVTVDVNILIYEVDIPVTRTITRVGEYQVVAFSRKILSYHNMFLKRALDILGGSVGILILGIAFIFVGPAIKLESPGPIFFSQTRVGKNGRRFKIYKFRSMYADAERRKKELMEKNEMNGLMFKMHDDPRITKVGKFIRKTSIDELPQFCNVLKGDMSLVGTRPPTEDEFEQYKPAYKSRLSMVPGLTGLWQISGRSDITDFDEVVALDMKYIDNWSFKNDIKILFRTLLVVLFGKGSV